MPALAWDLVVHLPAGLRSVAADELSGPDGLADRDEAMSFPNNIFTLPPSLRLSPTTRI